MRFGEEDVEADRLGSCSGDTVEQRGMPMARPGPAAELLKAGIIDSQNDHLAARRVPLPAEHVVVDQMIDAQQCVPGIVREAL